MLAKVFIIVINKPWIKKSGKEGYVLPVHGAVGHRTLTNRAIATSSPGALMLGTRGHIQAPDGRPPLWSTVSVEADSATLADALSTAAVFMTLKRLKRLKSEAKLHRITVINDDGDVRSI